MDATDFNHHITVPWEHVDEFFSMASSLLVGPGDALAIHRTTVGLSVYVIASREVIWPPWVIA